MAEQPSALFNGTAGESGTADQSDNTIQPGPITRSDTASKTPDSHLYTEIVTLLVGPDEVNFSIHKNILISTSESFESILNGDSKESGGSIFKLPEDDPRAFQIYVGVNP